MTLWEYKTFRWEATSEMAKKLARSPISYLDSEIDGWLNYLGLEGWEIIAPPQQINYSAVVTCKRPLQ